MTPGARILSVVEIVNDIFLQPIDENFSSDKIIKNWIRNNRYAGSKDRKEITNNVFGIIKRYFSLDYIQKNNITLGQRYLELTIIYYIFYGGGKTNLFSRFNNSSPSCNLISRITYLVLTSIKTILFFALSMKLASEFLGSDGTTTIPLLLTNVSGSIGNSFFI